MQIWNCKSTIAKHRVRQFDSKKDYYSILGADESTSARDIEKYYKRMAARLHPDRGGSEEQMKRLNEAYNVLKDEVTRRRYDAQRETISMPNRFTPVSTPPAQDIGMFGHCLSAFLCLLVGLFLLFLVRVQWIWFLWPLAVLAFFVILFGIFMVRSALLGVYESLPVRNRFLRHTYFQEAIFWTAIAGGSFAIYLLLTILE